MTVVYPKVVLTVVFIPTVAYILIGLHPLSCLHILTVVSSLSDYSPQHSPHSYFMLLTLSAHAREGYSSHFVCLSVCLSVCLLFIVEKAPFSGLKLTSVHSR